MRALWSMSMLGFAVAAASLAAAQTPPVIHNSWRSGAPIPTAVVGPATAMLGGKIYVVGGGSSGTLVVDTQIYDPVADSWSTGQPLPAAIGDATAAVVNNVLYVIGGATSTNGSAVTNAVWAYSPKTKKWTSKSAMLTARTVAPAVVENNIIYVIGGWNGDFSGGVLANVESYNPATNTWTEEAPLPTAKMAPSVGLVGTKLTGFTIVAADGAEGCCPTGFSGDNVGYDASTNAWAALTSDAAARAFACYGSIGSRLLVAGGNDTQGPALNVTESFQLPKDAWKTLAPIPQPTIQPGSAVYKGQLYCIGGWTAWNGATLNNVQIYQP